MSLPIKPTEPIGEEILEDFLKEVEENENHPGKDTIILDNLDKLIL